MRFAFILVEKALYPVTVLCRVLCVSRSGFHAWCKRLPSARERADAQLAVQVVAVHQRSRCTYGSPRIHAQLRKQDLHVSRKRIGRIMRSNGLAARRKRRFRATTDSRHGHPIAQNVLQRGFRVERPNQVWVADVTAIWTDESWSYLAQVLDLYSRRMVGWAMSDANDTKLVLAALGMAVAARRPGSGLLHHSDRGSNYASLEYRAALAHHGIEISMSRKGNCWDNAVAESFFSTLRAELVDHAKYPTRAAARRSIGNYIDEFYNLERTHSYLGYFSPIEFELRAAAMDQKAS